ncbi:MAG: stalk domain-containing protein [Clostridiaceae bacterium]|nr:stalk domain-containing protein [Clostridiaceae bacterium]
MLVLMYMTGNFQNLYQNGKQIVSSAATTPDAATQPEVSQGGLIDSAVVRGKTVLNISNMPIGAILEEMGGTYEWNAAEQKATIHWNGMTVELWNGQKSIKVNGVEKEVDIAPNIGTTASVILPSGFAANEPDRILSWEEGSIQIWNSVQKDIQNPSDKKNEQSIQKIRTTP